MDVVKVTVRCSFCEERLSGIPAPAFAEMTYGMPGTANLYRNPPITEACWWLQPIRHDLGPPRGRPQIRLEAKTDGEFIPLVDPARPYGFGQCRNCRRQARVKVGTLIRRAEAAQATGARSIYVP